MVNSCNKGKEVGSRSDRDLEVKLSWADTVTLIHTDINFRVTDSVAKSKPDMTQGLQRSLHNSATVAKLWQETIKMFDQSQSQLYELGLLNII